MELFVELIANLYDAILAVAFILKFNNRKLSDRKLSLLFIASSFSVSTAFLFFDGFMLLHSTINLSLLLGLSFYLNREFNLRTVLAPVIFEIVLISSSTFIIFAVSRLFGAKVVELASGLSVKRILFLLLCKLVITSILIIILRFFSIGAKFKPLDLALYLLAPLMTIISLYTFITISLNENIGSYYLLILFSSVGLIFTNILTLLFFTRYLKSEQRQHELELMSKLNESEVKRYEEIEKIYDSVRITKHDLQEQLSYAEKLYKSGHTEQASEHIERIKAYVKDNYTTVHSGNRVIDNILYSKMSLNPEIRFIVTGTIDDLSGTDDIHLVSLFGNMLDNAIECTLKQEIKVIEISFAKISGFHNITCKNPISGSVIESNPDLATTKRDKKMHGYGIKSMRETAYRLGGMIEFYEKEGYFFAHAAIPI